MKPSLRPEHRKILEASSISPEVIQERGYYSITDTEASKLGFKSYQSLTGYVIPVRDVHGVVHPLLHPDQPRVVEAKGKKKKTIKYEWRAEKPLVLDVPERVRAKLKDATSTLFIIEGSKKVDAALSRGLDAIGLNGVYGWMKDGKPHPDFDAFEWKDRPVFIVFDSDTATNPKVRKAREELKKFLEGRGSKVTCIDLPDVCADGRGKKTGLDDYLASGRTVADLMALTVETGKGGPTPALILNEVEPWGEEVDGDQLLRDLTAQINRHVILPEHGALTLSLWSIAAHMIDAFDVMARLLFVSPAKRCGKTRGLSVSKRIVPRPVMAANMSTATLYRVMERRPTVLADELDRVDFENRKELISIINAGFERDGNVLRCVGDCKSMQVVSFPCFGAMAAASIGTSSIPDTVTDRSIVIPMTRKSRDQKVEHLRARKPSPLDELCRRAARWGSDHLEALKRRGEPMLPESLDDRGCDKWAGLLSIAEEIGGEWPARARAAAVALSGQADVGEDTASVLLLADVRDVFSKRAADKISSRALTAELCKLPERPWSEWNQGRGLTCCNLARQLKTFGIRSDNVWISEGVGPKTCHAGYDKKNFSAAFKAYLPPESPRVLESRFGPCKTAPNAETASPRTGQPLGPSVSRFEPPKQGPNAVSRTLGLQDSGNGNGHPRPRVVVRRPSP